MTLLASMTAVTSFDLNETKDMLHLAQAAYCDGVSPTQWNCRVCDNPVVLEKMIEHNGGKALVGYHSTYDALFVSFRGSENIENWIDNIQFELSELSFIDNTEDYADKLQTSVQESKFEQEQQDKEDEENLIKIYIKPF